MQQQLTTEDKEQPYLCNYSEAQSKKKDQLNQIKVSQAYRSKERLKSIYNTITIENDGSQKNRVSLLKSKLESRTFEIKEAVVASSKDKLRDDILGRKMEFK